MATLILTAVGTAVGGPIGGAIGAIIGQQADAAIFAPKARRGPRLGELSVQTSSYGTQIPKLFGTMRVAGTVIWATDLNETRSSSGGGKSGPKTINYSYSASLAVALSARPIRAVKRVWADGKLLRGAAGDFKTETKFRLYAGDEAQGVDPLIASAEGIGQAPAFRGIAYAMFEDLQLADFGNRIPSLTFEVEADVGPVTVGAIAECLSAGEIVGGATPAVRGYAASGDSVRGAIEALSEVAPLSLKDSGSGLVLGRPDAEPVTIEKTETGAARGTEAAATEIERRAAASVADAVSITYYDIGRDYQAGLQRAVRTPGPALRGEERGLAAALEAAEAKAIAQERLAAILAGRTTAKLRLPARRTGIRPGAVVAMEGVGGAWKVARWTLEQMVVTLDLVRLPEGTSAAAEPASAGRPTSEEDMVHGPTTLALLDLPLSGELASDRPQLLIAASGAGWRRAQLAASVDDGGSWQSLGSSAAPATMGVAVDALTPRGAALFDDIGSVTVQLLHDGMWLEGRDDGALVNGANLALLGEELIQFGSVEPLGGGQFRLGRLLRGRRGTEWAAGLHTDGERFVLIESDALTVADAPLGALGGTMRVEARGIGDEAPATAAVTIAAEALRPPMPVHLGAWLDPTGDLEISWVRRSRSGWNWPSGSDTPLGEESERYRVTITGDGGGRTLESPGPACIYSAAEQAADGCAAPFTIEVAQLGTFTASRAAILQFA